MRLGRINLFRRFFDYSAQNEQFELTVLARGSLEELKELQTIITETVNKKSEKVK